MTYLRRNLFSFEYISYYISYSNETIARTRLVFVELSIGRCGIGLERFIV